DRIFRFPRGYDRVVHRLARGLRIELGSPVKDVRWSRGRVISGKYESERALITVPLGVLQKGIPRFDPPLPEWKQRSISALAMGPVVKVILRFDEPLWPHQLAFLHARDTPV